MSRRTVRLTLDNMATLPAPCRTCLFWEMDPVRRARVDEHEAYAEKEAWVSTVLREWGSCGQLALVDDVTVGYVIFVPSVFVPGSANLPTAPISADALQLTTVYVDPTAKGGGIGRLLIQGMARDLIQQGQVRAVEAFGETRGGRHGRCVVPADFLSSVGFKTQRAHPVHPRMRMELKSALTWKDEVEQALEKLLGVVRPAPRPAPKPTQPPARS